MVSTAVLIVALIAASVIIWVISTLLGRQKQTELAAELKLAQAQREELRTQADKLALEKAAASEQVSTLLQEKAALQTRLSEQEKNLKEQVANLEQAKTQLKLEFENLAQKILDEKGSKFSEQSKEQINNILNPLHIQLKEFKEKVEKVYVDEATQRVSLKNEINKMQSAYETLSKEADNLVHALKADTKMQGDWGEINLRRILDYIGLREGVNYFVQPNYKNEAGENLRPDVVVNLPNNKQIILDSKVSLTAYERYVNASEDTEKESNLKEHIKSIRKHVTELESKKYEDLPEINTLDFVLMFIPVEAAYFAAIEGDTELYKFASEKKVLPVCPSTLLITMQLVVSLWRWDKQNRYANEISSQGAKLLEKFAGFLSNLDEVGKHLLKGQEAFDKAKKQLHQGPGNLISQAQKLTALGVKLSVKDRGKFSEYLDISDSEPALVDKSSEESDADQE